MGNTDHTFHETALIPRPGKKTVELKAVPATPLSSASDLEKYKQQIRAYEKTRRSGTAISLNEKIKLLQDLEAAAPANEKKQWSLELQRAQIRKIKNTSLMEGVADAVSAAKRAEKLRQNLPAIAQQMKEMKQRKDAHAAEESFFAQEQGADWVQAESKEPMRKFVPGNRTEYSRGVTGLGQVTESSARLRPHDRRKLNEAPRRPEMAAVQTQLRPRSDVAAVRAALDFNAPARENRPLTPEQTKRIRALELQVAALTDLSDALQDLQRAIEAGKIKNTNQVADYLQTTKVATSRGEKKSLASQLDGADYKKLTTGFWLFKKGTIKDFVKREIAQNTKILYGDTENKPQDGSLLRELELARHGLDKIHPKAAGEALARMNKMYSQHLDATTRLRRE